MSVRETINKHPKVTGGIAIVFAIVAVMIGIWNVSSVASNGISTEGFYTVDDGATWFSEDLSRVPPFDHDGKPAVRAHVFGCPDKGEFVGFLERFTDKGQQALEGLKARNELSNSAAIAAVYESETQVKRPGEPKWVPIRSPEGQQVLTVTCANGSPASVVQP